MCYDRFDICEAHYLFATLYHEGQWSKIYEKFAQLERIGFSPSPLFNGFADLTDNGQEIFGDLVDKYHS